MSVPYKGNYTYGYYNDDVTSDLREKSLKRYFLAFQKGKPILDSELTESFFSSFSLLRNYIRAHSLDGAVEDSFKIVESVNNVNNFTITGGSSGIPAMAFVKGIPIIAEANFDYIDQTSLSSSEDSRTNTTDFLILSAPLVDTQYTVYVDVYFAEVSGDAGDVTPLDDSEYIDSSIKASFAGQTSANRLRLVQDIKVVLGNSGNIPPDGFTNLDGIYHWYFELATINRLASDNTITTAMIEDRRHRLVALTKLTDGTGHIDVDIVDANILNIGSLNVSGDINMGGDLIPNIAGTSSLGSPTNRFATLYMSSTIDTLGGLTIDHTAVSGSSDALKIIRSGGSTGNLFNVNDEFTVDSLGSVVSNQNFTSNAITTLLTLINNGTATFNSTVSISGILSLSSDIQFTTAGALRQNTSDGADNRVTYIAGGGSYAGNRGAYASFYGNEHSTNAGQLYLFAGQVATGLISLVTNGITRLSINDSGVSTFSGILNASSGTASVSTSTGALVVTGGVGVSGNLNVGGSLSVSGSFSGTGPLNITDATQSTNTSTGALTVAGGVGIVKNLNVGGNATITGDLTVNGTTTTINAANLIVTDKNITVNNGGNDASSEGAGLTVSRTSVAGSLIYRNSALGRFAIGDLGSEVNIVVESRQVNTSSPLTGGGALSSNLTLGINSSSSNTPNYVVQRDGSGNFSAGTITANLSGVATNLSRNVNVSGNGLSGGGSLNGADVTVTSNATSSNTGNTIVFRDGSGNFSAGTITASLSGTATTASNLTRNVNVSGNGLSGGGSLNGADVTITSNATSSNTGNTIVFRDGSGNFSAGTITASLSGTATTATTASNLTRSVNISGNGTSGSGSLNGGDVNLSISSTSTAFPSTIMFRDSNANTSINILSAAGINVGTLTHATLAKINVAGSVSFTEINALFGDKTLYRTIAVEGYSSAPFGSQCAITFGDASYVWIGEPVDDELWLRGDNNMRFIVNDPGGLFTFSNNSGNVLLHFVTPATGYSSTDGFEVGIESTTSDAYILNYENASLVLGTNSASRLSISGAGNVTINQNLTVGSNLTVNGAFTANSTSLMQGNVVAASDLSVYGGLEVSSVGILTYGGLTVTLNTLLQGSLNVVSNATVQGSLGVQSDASIDGNLLVTGHIREYNRSFAQGTWQTWSPTISAFSGSVTIDTSICSYTVVGKILTLKAFVQWSSASSLSTIQFTVPPGYSLITTIPVYQFAYITTGTFVGTVRTLSSSIIGVSLITGVNLSASGQLSFTAQFEIA